VASPAEAADLPGDLKITCPKDGTVMHKFRIPRRDSDAGPDFSVTSAERPRMAQPSTARPDEMVIDRCPACCGFWVDRGELEHVMEHGIERMAELRARALAEPHSGDRPTSLVCPREGARLIEMTDLRQGHIRYDMCPTCGGIFFDSGELTDLSAHTLAERVRGLVRRLCQQRSL